ncbi:hypothetical protein BDB01DRAFT_834036 [Pilobolus umbonatus]|nr:hypothetical protein BDB01DRAFT_834036 [Pilobolus umbonatus]
MYNNLTATEKDIYSLLTMDSTEMDSLDTALLNDFLDASCNFPLSVKESDVNDIQTAHKSTISSSTQLSIDEYDFNRDLMNFNISSQYTPNHDPLLTSSFVPGYLFSSEGDMDLNRRHSSSGIDGITDFNLISLTPHFPGIDASWYPRTTYDENMIDEIYHSQLNQASHSLSHHRSSLPNIHLPQEQKKAVSSQSTPSGTPRLNQMGINFNHLQPWDSNLERVPWNPPPATETQAPKKAPRKRYHSRQLNKAKPRRPIYPAQPASYPLPMPGVMSRRASVVTPEDIEIWNSKVNLPEHRIAIETSQEKPTKSTKKRMKSDEADPAEYPHITEADLEATKNDPNAIPRRQRIRYRGDDYTPNWVRYTGQLKEGYCDTCKPGKWLQLKNSAFWYHKQFFHGISSVSGKPFQKPLQQRPGENDITEGLCHQCNEFVPLCNSKRKNSVLWYRHAHKCHVYDKPRSKLNKPTSDTPTEEDLVNYFMC